MLIAPSILAADFANLGAEIKAVEEAGADWLHLDVMDGHFVPNLSFGAPVIQKLRQHTSLMFDVHLMISNPDDYLEIYANAGADIITVHAEACENLGKTLETIHALGKKAGVSLKPSSTAESIAQHFNHLDLILVMTVEPGFGGQEFLVEELEKIHKLRQWIDESGKQIVLEVDGGITPQTIGDVYAAGADAAVVGSAIFGASHRDDYGTQTTSGTVDYAANIAALKTAAQKKSERT